MSLLTFWPLIFICTKLNLQFVRMFQFTHKMKYCIVNIYHTTRNVVLVSSLGPHVRMNYFHHLFSGVRMLTWILYTSHLGNGIQSEYNCPYVIFFLLSHMFIHLHMCSTGSKIVRFICSFPKNSSDILMIFIKVGIM
jgi:hypothetical protein